MDYLLRWRPKQGWVQPHLGSTEGLHSCNSASSVCLGDPVTLGSDQGKGRTGSKVTAPGEPSQTQCWAKIIMCSWILLWNHSSVNHIKPCQGVCCGHRCGGTAELLQHHILFSWQSHHSHLTAVPKAGQAVGVHSTLSEDFPCFTTENTAKLG